MQNKTLIIIPSRIGSTRLPRKALIKIGDKTMVEHVALKVIESGLKNVFVATDDSEIEMVLAAHNIKTIITDPNCPTGTDRVFAAWKKLSNYNDFKYIINVQGDMPFIDPTIISLVAETLWKSDADIVTPVVRVEEEQALGDSNVKVVTTIDNRAIYFSRSMIPSSAKEYLYHLGVYGYKSESLEKFVNLPMSYLEKTERLEQLRALENNMTIDVCYANSIPISIDTKADLDKAISFYNSNLNHEK